MSKAIKAFGVFAIVMAIVATQAFFIVPETQQVIVLRFGDPVATYEEPGLKIKAPLVDDIRVYDSRVLDVDPPPEEVILSDQKRLVVDTFARYRIADVLRFYQRLQTENQATTRLHNLINSTTRSNLGNIPLNDLLSEKRAEIMARISQQVNTAANEFGVEIVDVRIGRADLPEQTSQSIYARMRSEREQEAAEFRAQGQELAQQITARADRDKAVILAEAEKRAEIIRGEGDEQAITTYAKAYSADKEFYSFYRSMNAYQNAISRDNSTLVLSPDSDFFRFLDNADGR